MIRLVIRNLRRRPLRNGLTLAGIAIAMGVLVAIVGLGEGYRHALRRELERSGVQMMLVPLGCPYDAAARVLKNKTLDVSLPAAALSTVRADPAVAVAAPLLLAALPHQHDHRTDLWVGVDETALLLKPWWQVRAGQSWFAQTNDVILGIDAAALELRGPGDKFYSPELKQEFHVAAVLERSGTSDDSAFFIPLAMAQQSFGQTNRLTAVAIQLKDPTLGREASARLQQIQGAQVVTLTEMLGTFLNLLGSARALVLAVASIAVLVSALTAFNTLLAAVLERTGEIAVMRAIGASRSQVFAMLLGESLLLSALGAGLGLALAALGGSHLENAIRGWLPFAPNEQLLVLTVTAVTPCWLLILVTGIAAAVYPAWRAARLQPAVASKFS